jgi:hypothetical protein
MFNIPRDLQGRPILLSVLSGKLFGGTPRSDRARIQSEKLGVDCVHGDANHGLMLDYVAQANQIGLVLFFSSGRLRLDRNVKAVVEPDTSPTRGALFGLLVK